MMELLHTFVAMIREHRWGAVALVLFMGILAACEEIPVDPDTANVTRRTGDTVIRYDTTTLRDTLVEYDTVVTIELDTIITTDTVIKIKEIIIRDTIKVGGGSVDTLTHYDTIRVLDTIRVYEPEQIEATAILFRKKGEKIVDSLNVVIDRATKLTTPSQDRNPSWMGLKFVGRVQEEYDTVVWEVAPSMIYLVIQELGLDNGKGRKELFQDPRSDGNNGLAVVPHSPLDGEWLATGRMGEGEFVVTKVDINARYIYAYVKARFNQERVHLDSMVLKLKY